MRISQREIYDQRYAEDGYDTRSAVAVLTAEANALQHAVERATQTTPDIETVSLLDYGYGTGRVTNDFALEYPYLPEAKEGFHILAYDVSLAGLQKAMQNLKNQGFALSKQMENQYPSSLCRVATASKSINSTLVTYSFVLGDEDASPTAIQDTWLETNDGRPFTLTSSWYGSVVIRQGEKRARYCFECLETSLTRKEKW